jgi:hypothetical protein
VGPRAGLDDVEKRKFLTLLGLELRPLGRPARSQSLYQLHYPSSHDKSQSCKISLPARFIGKSDQFSRKSWLGPLWGQVMTYFGH